MRLSIVYFPDSVAKCCKVFCFFLAGGSSIFGTNIVLRLGVRGRFLCDHQVFILTDISTIGTTAPHSRPNCVLDSDFTDRKTNVHFLHHYVGITFSVTLKRRRLS